jgi:tetratricopeptide (TPR) repeat protein
MYQRFYALILVTLWMVPVPLFAQQPCPNFTVTVGSDEDVLMLSINGAENPQDQIAALDKFVQEHADSKFITCANEYYASINLKLNNADKSIEFAEKDLAANYQDLNLLLTLMRAYVASNKVSDTAFDAIGKVPDQITAEIKPSRPPNASDADWDKIQKDAAELAKDSRAYAVYAFFQLLPRMTDAAKRVQALDNFIKTYPESEKDNAGQINAAYFQAYQMQSNLDKTVEYGEKTLAADPNNLVVLNTMGLIDAFYVAHPVVDKAADYAQKALTVAQDMKKPEGVDDAAFKKEQNNQLGIAHLTLGYAAFVKGSKTKKLGPAIDELKMAGDLLEGNPALQGQAYYYMGYAYESGAPANHHGAMDALTKAADLPGQFQGPARDLLAKVKAAAAK